MKVEMNEICVGYAIRAIIFVDSTRDTQTKVWQYKISISLRTNSEEKATAYSLVGNEAES